MGTETKDQSHGRRAFGSTLWAGAGRLGRAVAQVLFMLALGRTLGPEGFATATIALIGYQLASTMATQSFSVALVRYSASDLGRDAAAFWLNIGLVALLVVTTLVLGEPLARAFDLPELSWLLPMMTSLGLIAAPTVLAQARLSRDMAFRRIAMIETLSSITATVVGVAAAVLGTGLLALVLYAGVQRLVESVAFMRRPEAWPNRWPTRTEVPALLRYTTPIAGAQVLTFLNNSIDQFFVAQAGSPASLGYYGLARRLTQQPAQMIAFATNRAIFPSLVHIRENEGSQASLALDAIRFSVLFASLPLFLLAAVAEDFVRFSLGPDWVPASVYLELFALISSFLPLGGILQAILQAEGRTLQQLIFRALRLMVTVIVLSIMAAQGADTWTMAIAVSVITLLSFLPPLLEAAKALRLGSIRILSAVLAGVLPATAMLIGLWFFQTVLPADMASAITFSLTTVLGLVLGGAFALPQLLHYRRKELI